jgi:hypothetical protein
MKTYLSEMTMELKTCPFCGAAGKLYYADGSYGYYAGKYSAGCSKGCVRTGAFEDEAYDPRKGGMYSTAKEAKTKAAAIWNKRA